MGEARRYVRGRAHRLRAALVVSLNVGPNENARDREIPLRLVELPATARIVVVSDTHMPRMAKRLPAALCAALEGADLVIHAGDFMTEVATEALESFAPLIGVAGNNDDEAIRQRFPPHQVIEWACYRIGLTHGHEGRGRTTPERALGTFTGEQVDAVIFGHSHIPLREVRHGVLLFNPGSPTDRRRQPHFSYGILEARDGLTARHVTFSEKA